MISKIMIHLKDSRKQDDILGRLNLDQTLLLDIQVKHFDQTFELHIQIIYLELFIYVIYSYLSFQFVI